MENKLSYINKGVGFLSVLINFIAGNTKFWRQKHREDELLLCVQVQ